MLCDVVLVPDQGSSLNSQPSILQKPYYKEQLRPGINLCVLPRQTVGWKEFCRYAPRYSIALDGFVDHQPDVNLESGHANFDHHRGVNRPFTACTSLQVKRALKTGLAETFNSQGSFLANIFVNDPDQDTSLAVWLLKNQANGFDSRQQLRLEKLVEAEDIIDCTAGTYPVHYSSKFLEKMAWIFEPYAEARRDKRLATISAQELGLVINRTCERIDLYVKNKADRLALDMRYLKIGGGCGWSLVEEKGADARAGLFRNGIKAFVAIRRNNDSTYTYSIGKLSAFVDFPIEELYDVLNRAEGISLQELDCWGGSNIIGGSPRSRASKLAPNQIEKIINEYLIERNKKNLSR